MVGDFLSSIRGRLLLLVMLAVAPFAALVLYAGWEVQGASTTEASRSTQRVAASAHSEHERLVASTRLMLRTLALTPEVRGAEVNDCNRLMGAALAQNPQYLNLAATSPTGLVNCSGLPSAFGLSVASRAFFQRAMESRDFAIGDYQIGQATGLPSIVLAHPILDTSGRPQGVVYAALNLDWLESIAESAHLPPGSALIAMDRDGTIVVRYPDTRNWAGKSAANEAVFRAALRHEDGGEEEAIGIDGVRRAFTFATIGTADQGGRMHIGVGIPVEQVNAVGFRVWAIGLGLLALVSALAIGVAWFGGNALIGRQVAALTQAATRVAAGELGTRTGLVAGRGELAELAKAFDDMSRALKERDEEQQRADHDIRRLNQDLEHRAEQLQAANRELEAFTYTVSHDLRAPLRALDGFSRILLEEGSADLSPESVRHVGIIRDNAQRMGHLIDDLLTFSRVGRQAVNRQQVAVGALVRQAMADLTPELDGRNVEVVIGSLPACWADAALLRQVFANLLGNAVKFTRKRESAKIEVGCLERQGEKICFVRDNGVGFDMRYVDKLFGVFQRLHSAAEYEGTGVGLAIVRRIVQRHGGRVWAEAEVDNGATFYFALGGHDQDE